MPYVLPRFATSGKKLAFILAFGDLSYLELCAVLGPRISKSRQPWSDIALVELSDEKGGFEKLAGMHKVAVSITDEPLSWDDSIQELEQYLREFDDDFNFSVSLYSPEEAGKQEYEEALSTVLSVVRASGFRKANMIRPRNGTEVLTREIMSRKIVDIIAIKLGDYYWLGATSFIPDTEQFQIRSNERPVVSADISISSRLARVLLNVGGVSRGQVVLDPFCGAGTILSEAVILGADCIGIDRDPHRIENTKHNLEWLSGALGRTNQTCSLEVGDAMKLRDLVNDATVDAVVTEPILLPRIDFAPAQERARKLIKNASMLYSESLYSIARAVKKGGKVVIVTPSLRSASGKDVSVILENLEEIGLRPFQPGRVRFEYPVRISHEKTRWVKRLVYVFERV
jgi:tRNA G10  N-methylase Trm11